MRRLTAAALSLAVAGCAQPGSPPGGPPDFAPPQLVRSTPDSGAVAQSPEEVTLRFDEVVSERPAGTGTQSLEDIVLLSPSTGPIDVRWRRQAISIEPADGFRPNTAYTVTVLPGLADLRGNVRREPVTVVFSTGPTIPATRLTGVVFDWGAGTALAGARVQAITGADSVAYETLADSSGRFGLVALQPGRFLVRAFGDRNRNRDIDPAELWDSTTVVLEDSAHVELYAFVHDTTGPRVESIAVTDSVTLRVRFTQLLLPDQPADSLRVRVTSADSTVIPVASVALSSDTTARADTIARADTTVVPPAPTDTARAPRDTLVRAVPLLSIVRPSRPIPPREIVVRVARPLAPGTVYRVRVEGARNLLGVAGASEATVEVPKAAAPPPAPDSAGAPGARPPGVPATPPPR